jgi:hypothetical protein
MKILGLVRESCAMKGAGGVCLTVILAGAFLAGCQGSLFTAKGHMLQAAEQIMISKAGQQSGQYTSDDLTMGYTYARTGDSLRISGAVQFASSVTGNFLTINTFELGLLLADAQGKILQQHGLTTALAANSSNPIDFSITLSLPPGCESMAFTYNFQATDPDERRPSTFWQYPVSN